VTDAVLEEVRAWQMRPLEGLYPILFLDALMVKMGSALPLLPSSNRNANLSRGGPKLPHHGPRLSEHAIRCALCGTKAIYDETELESFPVE
jgi:hypothetical protein